MEAHPMYKYFSAVAGPDQQIDAKELQGCLTRSAIYADYNHPFSLETCRIMITMLDHDCSGKMGINELKELFKELNYWKHTFMKYDSDRSGAVESNELNAILNSFGYQLSPKALTTVVNRYALDNRITYDDFVACCVRMRALTDKFKKRDTAQNGTATFQYDDFIQVAMYF